MEEKRIKEFRGLYKMNWQKVPPNAKGKAPPYWLEFRQGKAGTSFRVVYRREGVAIRSVLDSNLKRWEDAAKAGEALIAKAKFGERAKPKNLISTLDLCDEIVELKKAKSASTYKGAEIYFRVHIKPFLAETCPYAGDLNPTVWLKYKNDYRLKHPDGQLFNHWKHWLQLFKIANERGIIPKFKLEFNEKKDDNRALGQVIPDEHLRAFLAEANRAWTDRVIIQRLTGQRPSVIRRLAKANVDLETGTVSVPKLESKNRRNYQFRLPRAAIDVLKCRIDNGSPYFFPSEADKGQPADKHLNGWHNAWKRAGVDKGYTPHDIRHTYLTEKVNTAGTNLAVLCYACDLSLDELTRTYVHFRAGDTQIVADDSDAKTPHIFGDK